MKESTTDKSKINSKIFTFLNDTDHPPYLNLCIKTWHLNKPENYEIKILNNDNLHEALPKDALAKFQKQTGQCSFPHFIDYLAALVLYHNGGIFLDADTIFTQKIDTNDVLLNSTDLVVFAQNKKDICSGYMMANKDSAILEEIIRRYEFASYLPINNNQKRNFIISDAAKEFSLNDILYLDCEDCGYLMEKTLFGVSSDYIYKKYYFYDICSTSDFFKNSKGITALRNTITPDNYKKMTEQEFLSQDILLSKVLGRILNQAPIKK